MTMLEKMEEIFEEVQCEHKADWWVVFDSELMDEVDRRIIERLYKGDAARFHRSRVYARWYDEMAAEL